MIEGSDVNKKVGVSVELVLLFRDRWQEDGLGGEQDEGGGD